MSTFKLSDLWGRLQDTAVFMVSKSETGFVTITKGQYVNDAFKWILSQRNKSRYFISLIPFLRNLIEYTEGQECDEYKLLTSCLHIKSGSNEITSSSIINIWTPRFVKYPINEVGFVNKTIHLFIHEIADEILAESAVTLDEVSLENKIVLSIAIRLKAEEILISRMPSFNLNDITRNQTQDLYNAYKQSDGSDISIIEILDRVIMMTPDNIHLNAFMYEPIIDISIWHLIKLYTELKTLT